MSKYDLFGLGNALVDHEFHVTDQWLAELGIEKGLKTLIEPDRASFVLDSLTAKAQPSKACGGSGANSVIAAAAMGSRCYYTCQVADDANGHFYVDDIAKAGVDTNAREHMRKGTTGRCFVMVSEDAERTMNTSLGITGDLKKSALDNDVIAQSRAIYLEGYLITSPVSRATAVQAKQIARDNGVEVIGTFSDPGLTQYFKPELEELFAGGVDLLFCNEEEIKIFTGEEDLADAVKAIRKWTKDLVVTLGAKGAIIFEDGESIHIKGQPAESIDTNGAGDAFAGAFVHGRLSGWSSERSGAFACAVAARVVETFGPRLDLEEYAAIRQRYL